MASYPSSDQRCPRCQYPVAPGATTCANCGLALTGMQGAAPSSNPYPQPSAPDPYGAYPGNQPPTSYGSSAMNSAPTMQTPLYPPSSGGWAGSQPPQQDYPPPAPTYLAAYPGSQPQGGTGMSPTYPANQAAYPGSSPAYPGSQPQGGFPGGFSGPPSPAFAPASAPTMAPPTPKKGNGLKIAIIALVVLVILGGGGAAAYLLTRPKPVITVTSNYKVGTTPAGSTGTSFHFTGTDFSGNSAVTFLLDGNPAPGASTAQSDDKGNVTADLKVTSDWTTGNHTLSAKDASGYVPQTTYSVTIVPQGQADTPGPNGAPPDDTPSFTINATVSPQDAVTGQQFQDFRDTLTVTGKPDPAGGTVCDQRYDTNQPVTQTGTTSSGVGYVLTYIATCSGTYKGGMLTYTETATSYQIAFANGLNCRANVPFVNQDLTGSFSDANTLSGTYKSDAVTINCSNGQSIQGNPQKGTWTGSK